MEEKLRKHQKRRIQDPRGGAGQTGEASWKKQHLEGGTGVC